MRSVRLPNQNGHGSSPLKDGGDLNYATRLPDRFRAIPRRLDDMSDLTSRRASPANGVIADRRGAATRPTPRDNQEHYKSQCGGSKSGYAVGTFLHVLTFMLAASDNTVFDLTDKHLRPQQLASSENVP
jgi:hypothetical protein